MEPTTIPAYCCWNNTAVLLRRSVSPNRVAIWWSHVCGVLFSMQPLLLLLYCLLSLFSSDCCKWIHFHLWPTHFHQSNPLVEPTTIPACWCWNNTAVLLRRSVCPNRVVIWWSHVCGGVVDCSHLQLTTRAMLLAFPIGSCWMHGARNTVGRLPFCVRSNRRGAMNRQWWKWWKWWEWWEW